MKTVTIMRGLPGSGKTHWVRTNKPQAKVVSADLFFMDGFEYKYDSRRLGEAHNWCLRQYIQLLNIYTLGGDLDIVVDNTNTGVFEIAPYYRLAEVFGFDVGIVWIQSSTLVCMARNTHGVPPVSIQSMANKFDCLPPWWKQTIIVSQ